MTSKCGPNGEKLPEPQNPVQEAGGAATPPANPETRDPGPPSQLLQQTKLWEAALSDYDRLKRTTERLAEDVLLLQIHLSTIVALLPSVPGVPQQLRDYCQHVLKGKYAAYADTGKAVFQASGPPAWVEPVMQEVASTDMGCGRGAGGPPARKRCKLDAYHSGPCQYD